MINLLIIEELNDGTKKLKSQLYLKRNTVDFIIEKDNIIKCYQYGKNGFGFYPYSGEYKIVDSISDLNFEKL